MQELLNKTRDINQDIFRNIVSLRKSEDLFSDLTDGDEHLSSLAVATEMRVKMDIPNGVIERGFHYSTAIQYPFEIDSYIASRYSDGHFPVWYGSLELETTIYEMAFHMMRAELNVEGVSEVIYRERAVYLIHCFAVMIDLVDKKDIFTQLIAENYNFTQQLASRLQNEGHPGLLAPSARYKKGINAVVFNKNILSDPRLHLYLNYEFNPKTKIVRVARESNKACLTIEYGHLIQD